MGFLRAWLAANRWVGANREAAIEMVIADRNTNRETAAQIVDERSADGAPNLPDWAACWGCARSSAIRWRWAPIWRASSICHTTSSWAAAKPPAPG